MRSGTAGGGGLRRSSARRDALSEDIEMSKRAEVSCCITNETEFIKLKSIFPETGGRDPTADENEIIKNVEKYEVCVLNLNSSLSASEDAPDAYGYGKYNACFGSASGIECLNPFQFSIN